MNRGQSLDLGEGRSAQPAPERRPSLHILVPLILGMIPYIWSLFKIKRTAGVSTNKLYPREYIKVLKLQRRWICEQRRICGVANVMFEIKDGEFLDNPVDTKIYFLSRLKKYKITKQKSSEILTYHDKKNKQHATRIIRHPAGKKMLILQHNGKTSKIRGSGKNFKNDKKWYRRIAHWGQPAEPTNGSTRPVTPTGGARGLLWGFRRPAMDPSTHPVGKKIRKQILAWEK